MVNILLEEVMIVLLSRDQISALKMMFLLPPKSHNVLGRKLPSKIVLFQKEQPIADITLMPLFNVLDLEIIPEEVRKHCLRPEEPLLSVNYPSLQFRMLHVLMEMTESFTEEIPEV